MMTLLFILLVITHQFVSWIDPLILLLLIAGARGFSAKQLRDVFNLQKYRTIRKTFPTSRMGSIDEMVFAILLTGYLSYSTLSFVLVIAGILLGILFYRTIIFNTYGLWLSRKK